MSVLTKSSVMEVSGVDFPTNTQGTLYVTQPMPKLCHVKDFISIGANDTAAFYFQ